MAARVYATISLYGPTGKSIDQVANIPCALPARRTERGGRHAVHFTTLARVRSTRIEPHLKRLLKELAGLPEVLESNEKPRKSRIKVVLWIYFELMGPNSMFILPAGALDWLHQCRGEVFVDVWTTGPS
jgi:hypothetical protein